MSYQSVRPSDGKTIKKFDERTDEALEESLATAASCFEQWRKRTYAERAAVVRRGLGGSVFTQDIARGMRVASRVDTGMMFINNISWADAELPFGGLKNSGYGRELGDMGIQTFVNKKLVRTGHIAAPV